MRVFRRESRGCLPPSCLWSYAIFRSTSSLLLHNVTHHDRLCPTEVEVQHSLLQIGYVSSVLKYGIKALLSNIQGILSNVSYINSMVIYLLLSFPSVASELAKEKMINWGHLKILKVCNLVLLIILKH